METGNVTEISGRGQEESVSDETGKTRQIESSSEQGSETGRSEEEKEDDEQEKRKKRRRMYSEESSGSEEKENEHSMNELKPVSSSTPV